MIAGYARQILKHRCTTQRKGDAGTDEYYVPKQLGWANYLQGVPCIWWTELGRGEVNEVNRDSIVDTARMIVFDTDVLESDRIINITDRRGVMIDAGPWEITTKTPRPGQGGYLLFLERVR